MDGSDEVINLSLKWKGWVLLSLVSCVQPGALSSVFTKAEWIKVIHKDSTRCIVESPRAGINKRKATR